jgi:hypothetical protein
MDHEMVVKANGLQSRFEGRLYTDEGRLYYVVEVNKETGFARVSYRQDDQQQVKDVPVNEVAAHLATSSKLMLDGLSNPDKARRLVQEEDGWYFSTREGRVGPHSSEQEADDELTKYILSIQTKPQPERAPRVYGAQSRA